MDGEVPVQPQFSKFDQMKNNLKAWNFSYWLVFFMFVPILLVCIFALPQAARSDYFIFWTSNLTRLQTYVLSGYTHSELYPHLIGNMALYLIAMSAIFAFETSRRRFCIMAVISLILVPVICSFLTIGLWHSFGKATSMQGFSGINAAFLAYAFMAGVTWLLGGSLELFDHKGSFPGPVWRYHVSTVLLTIILALIVYLGIDLGQFVSTGAAISNGIAHFGGFVTGLISFVIIDVQTEKRKKFDGMLVIALVIGIIFYTGYLIRVVEAVKGL
jgi:hypothetical protein